MSDLFLRCLSADYESLSQDESYATEVVNDTLFLYFEGSNGCKDWKRNFDFPIRRCGSGCSYFCHRGFFGAWENIKPYVIEQILDKSFKEIYIVGFSHGAAIALLCYEFCKSARNDIPIYGYGFGCPRVFWGGRRKKMREHFDTFTVIRNANDIVTLLPPALLGYFHVCKILKIGSEGKYSRIDAHRPENILNELNEYEKATE